MDKYLMAKRNELIWALSAQDYSAAQIGYIFGLNRSTTLRIIKAMPPGWQTPWKKTIG